MSDIAIHVAGIGKQYRIGGHQQRYRTLRDSMGDMFTAPFRRAGKILRGQATGAAGLDETFWALKDISFDIKQGEAIGVIGRNGAGKSTLLKILSRITEPTEGLADIHGRVGSLLEVGTGFHMELTGRENIYLNGSILGMHRDEINRRFDEIVAFAEVEKFIDTPVKHYSSGMYLRLAFAVAAHLEPEILLVDEVLAVGDSAFQKKCLGKMDEVTQEGRTVLFVSHNMAAVKALCTKGLLLQKGRLATTGPIENVISQYVQSFSDGKQQEDQKGKTISFTDIKINDSYGGQLDPTQPFTVSFTLNVTKEIPGFFLDCDIQDTESNNIIHTRANGNDLIGELKPGSYDIQLQLPAVWLKHGVYSLYLSFRVMQGLTAKKWKYLSDPVMLSVEGDEAPGYQPSILIPAASWDLHSEN